MGNLGLVFVLTAPSGAGKSTLAHLVVCQNPKFFHPVSCTTRSPRPNEADGRDYHFISQRDFEKKWSKGELLERTEAYGSFYGIPKKDVSLALKQGKYVILTIDFPGAQAVLRAFPKETVRIFILPPDQQTWLNRLKKRQEKDVARRVANIHEELTALQEYDYCLVNDEIEKTVEDFFAIVRAEELKRLKWTVNWSNGAAKTKAARSRRKVS